MSCIFHFLAFHGHGEAEAEIYIHTRGLGNCCYVLPGGLLLEQMGLDT